MPYLGRRSTKGGRCRPSFPVFRPKAGRCRLPVLAVGFHSFGAALVPVLVGVVVSSCAASAALQKRMAAGHPFMGRGGRLDRGNPEGVPRPQAALRRFVLLRRSSYPRFSAFQLQAIFIGKKKLEAPYRFRGGAISRGKVGVSTGFFHRVGLFWMLRDGVLVGDRSRTWSRSSGSFQKTDNNAR